MRIATTSFGMSVRPSVCLPFRMEQLGPTGRYFNVILNLQIFREPGDIPQFLLKLD